MPVRLVTNAVLIWTLRPAGDEQRGHGLLIVSELSRACGIMGDQRGRTLRFELRRPP